ncbi:hypothetical protein DBR06_SOUSAS5310053, partial [Sousa chinensis]
IFKSPELISSLFIQSTVVHQGDKKIPANNPLIVSSANGWASTRTRSGDNDSEDEKRQQVVEKVINYSKANRSTNMRKTNRNNVVEKWVPDTLGKQDTVKRIKETKTIAVLGSKLKAAEA